MKPIRKLKLILDKDIFLKVFVHPTKQSLRQAAVDISQCSFASTANEDAFCWRKPDYSIRKCIAEIHLTRKNDLPIIVHELSHAVSYFISLFPEKVDVLENGQSWRKNKVKKYLTEDEFRSLTIEDLLRQYLAS